ncbi:putative G-protein coupled receptor 139 [Mustelus asterias]
MFSRSEFNDDCDLVPGKCDLSSCTTHDLVAIATADLLLIFIEVILRWFRYYYYPLDIILVCIVVYILYCTAIDCSVWFTISFYFDRFVSICYQQLKTKYCTKNMVAAILSASCVLRFVKNQPFSFRFKLQMIIDNIPWFCYMNLMTIVILSRGKCDLSSCTTRYLVAMATADLLLVFIEVILRRFRYYYYPLCFLDITPVCTVVYILYHTIVDCSVWFTITFSFDRFVSICCQKLKTKYCTRKMAAGVLSTTYVLLFIKNLPFYFRFVPKMIINKVPWFCTNKPSYFTDTLWIGFKLIDTTLTPLLPFALILLLNGLTVRYILVASSARKRLRGQNKGKQFSDPEMASRRKSVILLFSISGSFILLWLVNVLQRLHIEHLFNKDSFYIFEQVGYLLRNLSCCTNTFIYGATQSKFREHCKKAIKYPITSVILLFDKENK